MYRLRLIPASFFDAGRLARMKPGAVLIIRPRAALWKSGPCGCAPAQIGSPGRWSMSLRRAAPGGFAIGGRSQLPS